MFHGLKKCRVLFVVSNICCANKSNEIYAFIVSCFALRIPFLVPCLAFALLISDDEVDFISSLSTQSQSLHIGYSTPIIGMI